MELSGLDRMERGASDKLAKLVRSMASRFRQLIFSCEPVRSHLYKLELQLSGAHTGDDQLRWHGVVFLQPTGTCLERLYF